MAEPTIESANTTLELSAHFRRMANAPLKKQNSSDAWNERQNRLLSSREALKLLIKGTMDLNQAKRAASGSRSSK